METVEKTIGVLLVDDHQTMLWGLSKLIDGESPHMKVVGTARNGAEAVQLAERDHPDVILLDLDLNGESALDFLPKLLSNTTSRILILTAEREQNKLDLAVISGAHGVLLKDCSAEEVVDAIEQVHRGKLFLDSKTIGRVFARFTESKRAALPDPELEKQASLTDKERKIVHAVVAGSGAPNKALAERLFISEHTLRNHLTSIYQKLGVSNRLELYVYAVKHRLEKTA